MSRASAAIAAHAALDALAEHVAGCDAVYLACFGDPGLAALREISPVPVIGMAEASCLEACNRGRRFAIVTGGALWGPMLTEFVAWLGLAERLRLFGPLRRPGTRSRAIRGRARPSPRPAPPVLREDGADVVILGGAALAGLAARIQPSVPIPVLCSVEAGTRAAIAAAARANRRASPPRLIASALVPIWQDCSGKRSQNKCCAAEEIIDQPARDHGDVQDRGMDMHRHALDEGFGQKRAGQRHDADQ